MISHSSQWRNTLKYVQAIVCKKFSEFFHAFTIFPQNPKNSMLQFNSISFSIYRILTEKLLHSKCCVLRMCATFNFQLHFPFDQIRSTSNSMSFIERLTIWLHFHWNVQYIQLSHSPFCTIRIILLCNVWSTLYRIWKVFFVNISFHLIICVTIQGERMRIWNSFHAFTEFFIKNSMSNTELDNPIHIEDNIVNRVWSKMFHLCSDKIIE